ncbi:MAG: hypothetical protein M1816_007492 [Peltula sp. TS41687]|nr:MAG: hypothetical protein M1816_007492 [Peltula sp. TS41687]
MAYFYCARAEAEKERANPEEIVWAILKQLCSGPASTIHELVRNEYEKRKRDAEQDGSEPEKLRLEESANLILALTDRDPATIVIDALDECLPSHRLELLIALETIIEKSANVVKILVSSRDDIDDDMRAKHFSNVSLKASDNERDIKHFVNHEIQRAVNNRLLLNGVLSETLNKHIVDTLVRGANGIIGPAPAIAFGSLPQHFCANHASRTLFEKGAELDARSSNGMTLLHYAAIKNNRVAIKLLLENGLDIGVKDNDGLTALDHANKNLPESANVVRLLIRIGVKGANDKTRGNQGSIVFKGLVTRFPRSSSSTSVKDGDGMTPL